MEQLLRLKSGAAAYLRERLSGEGIFVAEEFPADGKNARCGRIAVGLDAVELCGRNAQITLRFDLLGKTGADCHRLFDLLCAALLSGENRFGIGKLNCGELRTDDALSGTLLTAKAAFSGVLEETPEEDGAALGGVLIETEEETA